MKLPKLTVPKFINLSVIGNVLIAFAIVHIIAKVL